jgi:hypothetical protein
LPYGATVQWFMKRLSSSCHLNATRWPYDETDEVFGVVMLVIALKMVFS